MGASLMENKKATQRFVARFSSLFVALFAHSFHLFCFSVVQQLHQTAAAQHAPPPPPHNQQQIEVAPALPPGIVGTPIPLPMDDYVPDTDEQSTGRLNQFQGFYTPRPLPAGAQFTFASVWASWSAWSYCNGGVQMRVRACNTVRGFSCLGPNREVQPCEELRYHPSSGHKQRFREAAVTAQQAPTVDDGGNIYRVNDPWAEDRQEAMRQLSSQNTDPAVKVPPNLSPYQTTQPNDQQQQNAVLPTNFDPISAKGATASLQEIKDSIQLAQQQYWALSGQHAHMGTLEWGGGTKNKYNTKKQQQQQQLQNNKVEGKNGQNNSGNSEGISPRALSAKIESVTGTEMGNLASKLESHERNKLAKQLVDIEDRLQKTERKLQQNEQNLPTLMTSLISTPITTATVPTTSRSTAKVPAYAAGMGTNADKTAVEDITREWWKDEKHGAQQKKPPEGGRKQLHSDGGRKAVLEELTESAEIVGSAAEEVPSPSSTGMTPGSRSSGRTPVPKSSGTESPPPAEVGAINANGGGTSSAKSAVPFTASNKHWKRLMTSSSAAAAGGVGEQQQKQQHTAVGDNNRRNTTPKTTTSSKRTTITTTEAATTDAEPTVTPSAAGAAVKQTHHNQQAVQHNLSGHPPLLERLNTRQRTIVSVLEQQQKRKQYSKEGDMVLSSSLSPSAAAAAAVQQRRQLPQRGKEAKKIGRMSAESQLSTDTAQALKWMLANMSKSVEDVVQLQHGGQQPSGGGSASSASSSSSSSSSTDVDDDDGTEEDKDSSNSSGRHGTMTADDAQKFRPSVVFPSKMVQKVRNNSNGTGAAGAVVVRPALPTAKSRSGGQLVAAATQRQQNAKSSNLNLHRAFAPGKPLRIGPGWESGEEQQMGEDEAGDEAADSAVAAAAMANAMERHRKGISMSGEKRLATAKATTTASGRKSSTTDDVVVAAATEGRRHHDVQQHQQQAKVPPTTPAHSSSPPQAVHGDDGGDAAGAASISMEHPDNASPKLVGGHEEYRENDEDDADEEGEEEEGNGSDEDASLLRPGAGEAALSSEKSKRGQQKWQKSAIYSNGTGTSYEIGPVRIGEAVIPAAENAPPIMGSKNSRNMGNDVTTTAENDNNVWTMESSNQHVTNAQWTDWGPWGECICGKQMRSRVCHYEQHSNGCSGHSYEVLRCFASSANCPTTRPPLPPSRRNGASGGAIIDAPSSAQSNGIIRLRHLAWRTRK